MLKGNGSIVTISDGNKKLVSNQKPRFLIWSIPARKTCPFATAHCSENCYAVKAERMYPDCLPARMKNYDFSKTDNFVPFMVSAIHHVCNLKAYKEAEHVTIRIHESGDFYSVEYLEKWLDIAEACSDIVNLDFSAYTKSIPYLIQACKDGYNLAESKIRFISSIWDDTAPDRKAETEALNLPIYTAFENGLWDDTYTKCECADCGNCRKCYRGETATNRIAVTIH